MEIIQIKFSKSLQVFLNHLKNELKNFNFNFFLIFIAYPTSYTIPTVISGDYINSNQFLLLNNEFRNQTYVFGFGLNAAIAGNIIISVSYFKLLFIYFAINKNKLILSRLYQLVYVEHLYHVLFISNYFHIM
jgi:hypothetical protein